jgi:hypothetical protein
VQSQSQKPEKQFWWEVKLSRKGSCEKMSFKFLVKLRNVIVGNAKVEFWSKWSYTGAYSSFDKLFHKAGAE